VALLYHFSSPESIPCQWQWASGLGHAPQTTFPHGDGKGNDCQRVKCEEQDSIYLLIYLSMHPPRNRTRHGSRR
jgi:hypothetical protein